MPSLTNMTSHDVFEKLQDKTIRLIDIRERDEFERAHIDGAVSLPLSGIVKAQSIPVSDIPTVFMCRSGMRTDGNCDTLAGLNTSEAFILDGGLDAWKKDGLPVKLNKNAPLEINRQVQMIAGALILIGIGMANVLHPGFIGLTAFVGLGLTFAGVSGWCGMASLLRVMPWNSPVTKVV